MTGRAAEQIKFQVPEQAEQPLPVNERCLTEVDNLNRLRQADGTHAAWTLDETLKNLVPYVKEGGIPNAVHRAEHPYLPTGELDEAGREVKAFMWLGRTAVQNALSGRGFHRHSAALERVAVEVDEARDAEANLRPGFTKVFISPRMSLADAPREVAKQEHLADDDSVRCSRAVADEQGHTQKRVLESLLVRDIPLESWVAMLEDPDNLFGKSITVENPDSALSVMKVHQELEVPDELLPEGVITVIEAVVPYIEDEDLRASVQAQLERFREDQLDVDSKATNIAMRWRDFEVALADSLHLSEKYNKPATLPVSSFINSMQNRWQGEELEIVQAHMLPNGHYRMSRELAAVVERAKQRTFFVKASVITGNKRIIDQLDSDVAAKIYRAEILAQTAYASGYRQEIYALETQQDFLITGQKLKGVGGGCAGEDSTDYADDKPLGSDSSLSSLRQDESKDLRQNSSEKKTGKKYKDLCRIENCPSRPKRVEVGGCCICIDSCQVLFESGRDPNKVYATRKSIAQIATASHEFSLAA